MKRPCTVDKIDEIKSRKQVESFKTGNISGRKKRIGAYGPFFPLIVSYHYKSAPNEYMPLKLNGDIKSIGKISSKSKL